MVAINDYDWVLERLKKRGLDQTERKKLAAKVFNHTAYYDTLVAQYLGVPGFSEKLTVALNKIADRYGENPTRKRLFISKSLRRPQV